MCFELRKTKANMVRWKCTADGIGRSTDAGLFTKFIFAHSITSKINLNRSREPQDSKYLM